MNTFAAFIFGVLATISAEALAIVVAAVVVTVKKQNKK